MSQRPLRSFPEPTGTAGTQPASEFPERAAYERIEPLRRRQVVSAARRTGRLVGLHVVDGALIAGLVTVLTIEWAAARPLVPAITAIFLLSLNALGAYRSGDARRDRGRLLAGALLATLLLTALVVFPPNLPLSLGFLAAVALGGYATLDLGRQLADQAVRQVYLRGIGLRRAVLVGTLDEVGRAIQQLRDDHNIDQYLVGHLAPEDEPDAAALGLLRELPDVVRREGIEEVIVATELPPREVRRLAEFCFRNGIVLFIFPSVLGRIDCKAEPVRVGRCPLLHLYPSQQGLPAIAAKRVFDVVVAGLTLLVAAPLMLAIAIAIRVDSSGPIFYRQERVGLRGRRFRIWKFRSMRLDADTTKHSLAHLNAYCDPRLFKVQNDPRITRVGRWLRRTSLDELPQIFNVLAGEMSLVGPRPPLPAEVADYEPHHFVRLAVSPGITGPWQVNGRNLITDFEEVVRLERAYVESWSLTEDVRILLRTLPVVISGEGAY